MWEWFFCSLTNCYLSDLMRNCQHDYNILGWKIGGSVYVCVCVSSFKPKLMIKSNQITKVFIAIHTYMITGATIILTPNMSQIETQNRNMEKKYHMYGKGSMKPKQAYELHIWYTLKHSSICESVQLCQVQLCKKEKQNKNKIQIKRKIIIHILKMIFIVRHIKSM